MKNGHHEILESSHLHVQGQGLAPKPAFDYHMPSMRECIAVFAVWLDAV